ECIRTAATVISTDPFGPGMALAREVGLPLPIARLVYSSQRVGHRQTEGPVAPVGTIAWRRLGEAPPTGGAHRRSSQLLAEVLRATPDDDGAQVHLLHCHLFHVARQVDLEQQVHVTL